VLLENTITTTKSVSTTITIGNYELSDYSDIAQVIIAIFNIILACYIFYYQIRQGRATETKDQEISQKSINLQWFKDLIIQPNYSYFISFIDNLKSVRSLITSSNLSDTEIIEINNHIKLQASHFRVNFNDSILKISPELYRKIKMEVEDLVTNLTTSFSDENHDFTDPQKFEKEILEPIHYCKNNIIALIFSYTGERV